MLQLILGIFEVVATCGDTQLGGQDFDGELVKLFMKEFEEREGINIAKNARALRKLKDKCQETKHILSTSLKADIEIDSLADGVDFDSTITRSKFEVCACGCPSKCVLLVLLCW